jgi:hypothetical protein
MSKGSEDGRARITIRNEFAHMRVELDRTGKGPRLKIQDLRTDQAFFLDPLELESLAWSLHEDLAMLLDPSHRRWREDD